ncbi:MAG: 4-hydroxy-tetrahydrodipicolinate synthase [Pseudomonadota bacterium]
MNTLKGSMTALITPFRDDRIDDEAFVRLVERQIDQGTHALVPTGTTGEAAALTDDEHEHVVRLCVETARGRIPVIAGAGSNVTASAIELSARLAKTGIDGFLHVTGYYNRPNQDGLYAHYEALSAAFDLPIIVYNIPARCVVGLSIETLARVSRLSNIVGVKDATGDLARIPLQTLQCQEGFLQISGEDMTAVGFNAMGGVGCISVCSNVAPELCAQMQEASLDGDYSKAQVLQDRLAPLHDALFSDASPGPTKYALSLMGLCADDLRLPLTAPSNDAKAKVRAALEGLDLI